MFSSDFYAVDFSVLRDLNFNLFLIAASDILGSYYCAPNFLQFKEFELYWGTVFLRLEEEYLRSPFFFNFIGMNFEAGTETREKFWSDLVAEQNEEWSEKRVAFCSYRYFLESEKLR